MIGSVRADKHIRNRKLFFKHFTFSCICISLFKKIVAELKIISKFAPMKRQLHLSDKKINIFR